MSALREIVRDDALAIAKSCGHPTVEPRHVLWGVIRALQGDAPADIPFEGVLRLLEPHGTSDGPPAVPPEMEATIGTVTDTATALGLAHRLATDLGVIRVGEAAAPAATPGPAAATTAETSMASATPPSRTPRPRSWRSSMRWSDWPA